MSATQEGPGIGRHLEIPLSGASKALRQFVAEQFRAFAPVSLAHEMKPGDFALRLRDDEQELAHDIIGCFDHLRETDLLDSVGGVESVDVLNDAFGQFIADSFVQEKELGQYLTPNEVVRYMVRLGFSSLADETRQAILDPSTVHRAGLVMDPSCGVGTFLTEALRVMFLECRKIGGVDVAKELVEKALESCIVGMDKSERMLRLALTNLAMFGAGKVNLHLANSLARSGRDGELTASLEGRAKLILTNPPFGASFDGAHLLKYKLVTEWVSRRPQAVDSELLFLERYLDWLAPGGHLVAIVPDSILTNKGIFEDMRKALFQRATILGVVSLPAVTFGVAGTGTKTSILHLTKKRRGDRTSKGVFFAVCNSVGYEVQTRGSTRTKIPRGVDQLPEIFEASQGLRALPHARIGHLDVADHRWDAVYHAGVSTAVGKRIERGNGSVLRVKDVADLSSERINPARLGAGRSFKYIEISDVDGEGYAVRANDTACAEAPSRARKSVRTGDVLVSTVRPERRTVGVVPAELDGSICSTGFAVLRCRSIRPLVLAHMLRHKFATEQIVKENAGIAYPAIEEERLLDIVLPIDKTGLRALSKVANQFEQARMSLRDAEDSFTRALEAAAEAWMQK